MRRAGCGCLAKNVNARRGQRRLPVSWGIGKIPLGRACAILVREASKFLPQYAATLPFMGRLEIDFH